jgi:hypothetical protein
VNFTSGYPVIDVIWMQTGDAIKASLRDELRWLWTAGHRTVLGSTTSRPRAGRADGGRRGGGPARAAAGPCASAATSSACWSKRGLGRLRYISRSDCIVPYLTLAKSTRLPILLCKYFNLAGAPKRTVGYLRNSTVRLAKSKILVQMSISLFSKSYGKSLQKFFFEPGFPHNFAKNDRQDLKMGCTDASRRQLQSVLKIGV